MRCNDLPVSTNLVSCWSILALFLLEFVAQTLSANIQFLAVFYKRWLSLENLKVITSEECARTRSEKHQKQIVCTAMYGLLKTEKRTRVEDLS